MTAKIQVNQIYYKPELKQYCEPEFVPYDNTANPRPQLREWGVWDAELDNMLATDLDYWGFFSWKFGEKVNLTGKEYLAFITDNPGYDFYFVNPCIINEAVFANSWEQGDYHHPNISAIGNDFFAKLGYKDIDVKSMVLDRNMTFYANFFVASREFWIKFMDFSRQLFTEADKDADFKHRVFGEGLSNYVHDKTLSNFTFVIERLLPTFIELEQVKTKAYEYTDDTVLPKYYPFFNELIDLSRLKATINKYESDELYDLWDSYRRRFLTQYPGITGLE